MINIFRTFISLYIAWFGIAASADVRERLSEVDLVLTPPLSESEKRMLAAALTVAPSRVSSKKEAALEAKKSFDLRGLSCEAGTQVFIWKERKRIVFHPNPKDASSFCSYGEFTVHKFIRFDSKMNLESLDFGDLKSIKKGGLGDLIDLSGKAVQFGQEKEVLDLMRFAGLNSTKFLITGKYEGEDNSIDVVIREPFVLEGITFPKNSEVTFLKSEDLTELRDLLVKLPDRKSAKVTIDKLSCTGKIDLIRGRCTLAEAVDVKNGFRLPEGTLIEFQTFPWNDISDWKYTGPLSKDVTYGGQVFKKGSCLRNVDGVPKSGLPGHLLDGFYHNCAR